MIIHHKGRINSEHHFPGCHRPAGHHGSQLEGIFLLQLQTQLIQLPPPVARPLPGEEPLRGVHGRRLRLRAAQPLQVLLDQAGQGLRGAVTLSRDTFGQVK